MKTIDLFLKKPFYFTSNTTKDQLELLLKENTAEQMISFRFDLKNSNYEWGKGWVNGATNKEYLSDVFDFADKIDYLIPLGKTSLDIKGDEFNRENCLNGRSCIFHHPMSWSLTLPANKVLAFFESWCEHKNVDDIRMIQIDGIHQVIDMDNKEKMKKYIREQTMKMLNADILVSSYNDIHFNSRKWDSFNILKMEDFWRKKTTFDKVRRYLSEESRQRQLDAIIKIMAPASMEIYQNEFLQHSFWDTKVNDFGDTLYKLKSPSKRKSMSKTAKEEMKKYDIDFENPVKKVKQKSA